LHDRPGFDSRPAPLPSTQHRESAQENIHPAQKLYPRKSNEDEYVIVLKLDKRGKCAKRVPGRAPQFDLIIANDQMNLMIGTYSIKRDRK